MASARDESKAVTPFMPSLLHCASVRIAISLFEEFGVDTLEDVYTEIQQGNLTTSLENSTKSQNAKEILLCIPPHLRRNVMEAAHGSHQLVLGWTCHHDKFKEEKRSFHWRSDGSIDEVKTAENLVQNVKFGVRDRFELSAAYCLKESTMALSAGMPESDECGCVRIYREFYLETERQRLSRSFQTPSDLIPRCSVIFPLMGQKYRQQGVLLLDIASFDDVRFCLYAMTKDEEKHMLQKYGAYRLLSLHLVWPLQSLFLNTAAKLWDYIDDDCFNALLSDIFYLNDKWKYLNYSEIFERFWYQSPPHLKESVKELPELSQAIDSYFEKKSRKRKLIDKHHSQNI